MAQKKKSRKKEISKIKKQAEKKQLEPKLKSAIKEKKIEENMPMEKKETSDKAKELKSNKTDSISKKKKESTKKTRQTVVQENQKETTKKQTTKKSTIQTVNTKDKEEKESIKKKTISPKTKTTKIEKKKRREENDSKKKIISKEAPKKKRNSKLKKKNFKEQGVALGKKVSYFSIRTIKKVKDMFFHFLILLKKIGEWGVILFIQFIKFIFVNSKEAFFSCSYSFKKHWQIYIEKKRIKQEMRFASKSYLSDQEETIVSIEEETKEIEKTKKSTKKRWPSFLVLIILGTAFFVFISFPYGIKIYRSGASGNRLEVPKLSKLKEECCNFSATFTSIRSVKSLQKELDKLISSYEVLNCDQVIYYYNPVGDYTITDYSVTNGKFFNEFTITYGKGNSCDIDTTFKKLELLSPSFSIEDAKRDGNYVIYEGKVFNPDAYDNFMKQVEQKNPAILRIVSTTKNGDVLITDLEYLSEGKFKVTHDKTRDRNNKDNFIMAYKYEHLGIYKNKLYAYNGAKLSSDLIKTKNAYYLFDVEK